MWKFLTQTADTDGLVKISQREVAVGVGYLDAGRQWEANAKNRIRVVLKSLREGGVLQRLALANARGEAETYQLLHLWRPKPERRRPVCRDPWILAFDERAAGWTYERRRVWRCVWLAIIVSADRQGHFVGDIAFFADSATERLGSLVTDDAVARLFKWSVDAALTEEIFCGNPSKYRIRIPRGSKPTRTVSETTEG